MADNTQSMIFTLYGDYISHYGNKIWIGSLIQLLHEFGHNEQATRVAISRMMKQGWVHSDRQGNKSYYHLTARGEKRIEEAAGRIFKLKNQPWDEKWRLLILSLPDMSKYAKDSFENELKWSGFGKMNDGCWISPNDLEEEVRTLLEKYEIKTSVDFFTTVSLGDEKNQDIVKRCWNFEETEEKYEEFIATYSQRFIVHQDIISKNLMTDAECFVERAKLVHEYRKFLFIDPGLPEELLPERWAGAHAAFLFNQYYKLLAEPANHFFESVFEKGNPDFKRNKNYDIMSHPLMNE